MFATPGPLPEGPRWRYEVHWAGLRVLAEITGGRLRLTSRFGRDVTARLPEFAGLAGRLRDGLLDAEVVTFEQGQRALMVSDVLRLYGVPLLHRPLDERRATLERLDVESAQVALSPVYDDGEALLVATRRRRLPGVLAKHADSPYRPGVRDPSWVQHVHP